MEYKQYLMLATSLRGPICANYRVEVEQCWNVGNDFGNDCLRTVFVDGIIVKSDFFKFSFSSSPLLIKTSHQEVSCKSSFTVGVPTFYTLWNIEAL